MNIGYRFWRQSQGFICQARICNQKGFSSSEFTYKFRGAKRVHLEELLKKRKYQQKAGRKMSAEGESLVTKDDDDMSGKRPQFGNRYLENPDNVFQHNAWDNVAWDPEQLEAAKKKVDENSREHVDPDKKESYETEADSYWDKFYSQHQNKFFKDRHWLFTEFPELSSDELQTSGKESSSEDRTSQETPGKESAHEGKVTCETESSQVDHISQSGSTSCASAQVQSVDVNLDKIQKEDDINQVECKNSPVSPRTSSNQSETGETTQANLVDFPGHSASKRILEVGCGVGNTIFPILQTNADPRLFIYGCDFSSVAIDIVRQHSEYVPSRCHAFVCDVSDPGATFPFPDNSLDLIVLIFVMSAINPDRFLSTIQTLTKLLKPGGRILFRDYGRYDMAQLRFKKGRCLSDNFYVRGDGTRVYFFTQDELQALFTSAGLVEEQNIIDRRLQVNRGRQLTMYRVWIQCKYRKP